MSRKKWAIKYLNESDTFEGWLVISSGNDPNFEYLVGRNLFSTAMVLLTKDELHVLVSKLEESMVNFPHVDSIETYYGTGEFFSKALSLLTKVKGRKILIDNAPPLLAPYAARILSSHEKLVKNIGGLLGITFYSAEKLVYSIRSIKTKEELEALKKAVTESVKIIEETIENDIKIGMTEKQVAALLYKRTYEIGVPSFDAIVAFGENTSNPHHASGEKKLREGEIGYIDAGVKIMGMCGDITRAFFTEGVGMEERGVYEAVYKAQEEAFRVISPGVSPTEPDKKAREAFEKLGYDPKLFSHGLGHPIGVEVHDVGPALSWLSAGKETLKPNMALTVEPALYFKGKFGIRLEDDVIVTDRGNIRLSHAPEEPPYL